MNVNLMKAVFAAASWVKKGGGEDASCNFPTDSCKFPTEEIWVLKNYNFAPKFPQNGGFLAPNCVLLD